MKIVLSVLLALSVSSVAFAASPSLAKRIQQNFELQCEIEMFEQSTGVAYTTYSTKLSNADLDDRNTISIVTPDKSHWGAVKGHTFGQAGNEPPALLTSLEKQQIYVNIAEEKGALAARLDIRIRSDELRGAARTENEIILGKAISATAALYQSKISNALTIRCNRTK